MSIGLPGIYWYLFCVGILLFAAVFSVSVMALMHRRNMKALELLELYAERGIAPPAALADLLGTPDPGGAQARGAASRAEARIVHSAES